MYSASFGIPNLNRTKPNLFHPLSLGKVSSRIFVVNFCRSLSVVLVSANSTVNKRWFSCTCLTVWMRNTLCMEKRTSFSRLYAPMLATDANGTVECFGSTSITNKIPIDAGLRRARRAKGIALFFSILVDKKLLKEIRPPSLLDIFSNSSLDIPCPRYTINGLFALTAVNCCWCKCSIWRWRSATKNPILMINSISERRNARLSIGYRNDSHVYHQIAVFVFFE